MPKASLRSLTETDLAAFQSLQTGNDCGLHAISAAIHLLTDLEIPPRWLIKEANRLWWRGRFYRVFPGWAITPMQLARFVNYLAKVLNLPLRAKRVHLSPGLVTSLIEEQNQAVLVTIYWPDSNAPKIYYGESLLNANTHKQMNAHTMLLAAHDPDHKNGDLETPWGFINSWVEKGEALFWMSDADFKRSWGFKLPCLAMNAAVLVTRTD